MKLRLFVFALAFAAAAAASPPSRADERISGRPVWSTALESRAWGTATDRWYNLVNAAKAEAVLGNRDAAMAHLKAAQALGAFVTDAWVGVDPSFATLRTAPSAQAPTK